MDNYRIRRNLSVFMTYLSMVIIIVTISLNVETFPLIAVGVMAGNAIAVIAHRTLFPHRWADDE